jgi:hypothetical protein
MAGQSSLNAKNLESLGAARLAELLITLSQGDAGAKRLLRLALAEQKGPAEIAREVRRRLTTIERSGSFLDDHQRDALLKDLERQRQAIRGPIAEHDPARAVELFWDLLALAEGLMERCDDSDAAVRDFFHQSSAALGAVALKAPGDPKELADQVYAAIVGMATASSIRSCGIWRRRWGLRAWPICGSGWRPCALAIPATNGRKPTATGSCASPCSTSPTPWAMPRPIGPNTAITIPRR